LMCSRRMPMHEVISAWTGARPGRSAFANGGDVEVGGGVPHRAGHLVQEVEILGHERRLGDEHGVRPLQRSYDKLLVRFRLVCLTKTSLRSSVVGK
jgi:hypothetical protein